MNDSFSQQWFALGVKLRHETVVTELLGAKGYETFSPVSRRAVVDKKDKGHSPLFPGYVFGKFDPRFRLPILMTPGVNCVVGYGRVPAPIATEEINAIREVSKAGLIAEPCLFLEKGMRVRLIKGPLAGVEGILLDTRSPCRVVLSVSLIHRSIRIEVDKDSVIFADSHEERRLA